ncbi:serine hydrolase domain-containing protein [Micromonospora sagamiensis]|uniref:CubicO group peptidase (Beta-lactamase class C family) n=1 Tax=Micromonospora sagamiensis TaxID=47875 RepID=A0A562WFC9_9ACTN|nr:serine hydrolase domain-containing protein [Micromonospora sagamiensis]TWJ28587.1 CubicO group peptidase (beta-lactamase class C family) [Micromonospora sagamiensis]BCL12510.1 FmtA-like protein [Micromonospora sagamiensis]
MKKALVSAFALLSLHASPAHASGAEDLGATLDRMVPAMLAADRIPGAAVVIVQNGQTVFSKGYGVADVTTSRPVDATTPFLTGSLAKVFTAEAVLRLAAEGSLDLDADVNRYLTDFQIKDTYPGHPVTLENLLTHTAGFDDDIVGLAEADPSDLPSLAESVKDRQPRRVRPPGARIAYDNYALALAGRIVEVRSGQPYASYVADHVFATHGMTGSSATLPHPAAVRARLARGYRPDGDAYAEQTGQYAPWTPSGTGPAVTPADMARYMTDQLDGDPIARQMQQRHFTADDRMPGMGYVLEERPRNGLRLLYKDGDVPGYHNVMALLPDQKVGVYVVVNGDGTAGAATWDIQKVVNKIVDQRFPGVSAPSPAELTIDVSRYAGSYRSARTSQTSLMKASTLFSVPTVKANPDGTLTSTGLSPDPDRATQHWVQTGPGLFQERDGQARISFPEDGLLVSTAIPSEVYEKLAWYDTPTLDLPLFAVGALALLLAALGLPIAAVVRRSRRARSSRPARLAGFTAWVSAVLITAFLVGFALVMADPNVIMATLPLGSPSLMTLPVLATLSLVFAVPMLPATVLAWRGRWWGPTARISYTLLTVAAAGFFTVAFDYRLLLF